MRILITESQSPLGRALVAALSPNHDVRTLDPRDDGSRGASPTFVGDARDRDVAAEAVANRDAIIHLGPLARTIATPKDVLDTATRGTFNLLTTATAAARFILVSSLRTFERYPMNWKVTEQWAPRPTTSVDDLVPYLAELTVREVARVAPLKAIALRMGEVVGDDEVRRDHPGNSGRLHVDDAIQAIERALAFEAAPDGPQTGWWVFHIVGGGSRTRFPLALAGQEPFNYAPRHDLAGSDVATPEPRHSPAPQGLGDRVGGTARRVVVFGAGGPLGAITTKALAHDHVLRLTDIRPLNDIEAEDKPQSPGAPVPRALEAPHESRVVDVTNLDDVLAATRGMDAIINCTVMRPHPVEAFRVNTLGAYHVMRAAVASDIRRVVHTGPQQVTLPYPAGYWYDFDLPDDVPCRPGNNLYILTKFLGQEICRIFAEEYDLEVPTLLFSSFVNPETPPPEPLGAFAFSVSWEDAATAMRQALRAPSFPRPFEVFHILGDLPHGKYSNAKAKHLLKWQPRDRLEAHWLRHHD